MQYHPFLKFLTNHNPRTLPPRPILGTENAFVVLAEVKQAHRRGVRHHQLLHRPQPDFPAPTHVQEAPGHEAIARQARLHAERGHPELRNAVATYMGDMRGPRSRPTTSSLVRRKLFIAYTILSTTDYGAATR